MLLLGKMILAKDLAAIWTTAQGLFVTFVTASRVGHHARLYWRLFALHALLTSMILRQSYFMAFIRKCREKKDCL
jgi:hypothetical protein